MIDNQPLVSIVIPFYNRFDMLYNTLNSVTCQTYKNYEVILIDDFSDNIFNLEAIKHFNFPTLKYERLLENKGPGGARRRGRELAEGEYIVYLDSDDGWNDIFLEECLRVMESDKSLGMVFSNTIKLLHGVESDSRIKNERPSSIIPTLFINTKRLWSTPSCLWRKDVSISNHWLPIRNHEDFLHDILCSKINNKIRFVPFALTYNNHNAENRIFRDKEEVRKALTAILHTKQLPMMSGISYFFLKRIYKNKLKIKIKELPQLIALPSREYRMFSNKWLLFQVLVILNILGIKWEFQKRNIEKLKP